MTVSFGRLEVEATSRSNLVAPCGMNCALCAGYLALTHGVKSKGIRMPACSGCIPRNKLCAYLKRDCPRLAQHEVTFCFECPDYPCRRLKTLDTRYRQRYHMSMIENGKFIKEHGMEKFLEAQKEKWRCPTCGGTICCHNGLCFNCDLEKLRNKQLKFRWEETVPK